MNKDAKKKIAAFLEKQNLGVVATIDAKRKMPESAVVAFAHTQELELIFGTSNKTRKYTNIKTNPNVSYVIGWDSAIGTLQYEGVAKEVEQADVTTYRELLIAKNPDHKKFALQEDQRYFVIKP